MAKQSVVGSGKHTYVWEREFFKLPPNVQIQANTHAIAIDRQGRIFVHSQSEHAVMVFDPKGYFIQSWGSWMKNGAHGMDLRVEKGKEYLYFALTGLHLVVKTTLEGEEVWRMSYPKDAGVYESEAQYVPTNVAFAPNGDFYVADGYGKSYIHQYKVKGEYIRTWGGQGTEPGKMNCPHGLWVDTRSKQPVLIVADRGNHRLQRFTLDGKHIDFVTDELRLPCHFDIRGKELLIPDLAGRVSIFDQNNRLIVHLGDNPDEAQRARNNIPRSQWADGHFISPHDACWDKAGNIYVGEWVADGGRLTRLQRMG